MLLVKEHLNSFQQNQIFSRFFCLIQLFLIVWFFLRILFQEYLLALLEVFYQPDLHILHRYFENQLTGSQSIYEEYADLVDKRPPAMLRDILGIKFSKKTTQLRKVESSKKILKRFDSAGMSLGALSPKAHETLAEAMNSLGSRSNSVSYTHLTLPTKA